MFRKVCCLLVWMFLSVLHLFAQSEEFFFTALDVKDGLSQQTVTVVFQDADGYMWLGTRNGLNRYDGYGFKVFRKSYDDAHSLSGNYIMDIVQDDDKDLWIATQQGLNRISYRTEEIDRYVLGSGQEEDSYITALHCGSTGRLLAFTHRHSYIYDSEQDTFRVWRELKADLPPYIVSVAEDPAGNLYLGSHDDGLWIFDSSGGLKEVLGHDPLNGGSLTSGYVSFLTVDSMGMVWIVMEDKYLYCYSPIDGGLVRVEEVENVRQVIDWDERFMLAGTFQGLVLLDRVTYESERICLNLGSQGGLSHYSVISLCKDREQNLWVGTYSGGVNFHDKHGYRFRYIQAREYFGILGMGVEDESGVVWFATEGGGLLSYDPKSGEQKNYLIHKREGGRYNRNIIKSILLEGSSVLCATHGGEVYAFSFVDKTFRLLYDFGYNDVYTLYRDSVGRLWIPTNTDKGLMVMDGERDVKGLNVNLYRSDIGPITSILEIDRNTLLLGTQKRGGVVLHLAGDSIVRLENLDFGFGKDSFLWITTMLRDHDGNFWVATNGAGLFMFDRELKLAKRYFKANGLFDERVYGLVLQADCMWLMTSRELYCLNRDNSLLERFYAEGGIIPEEFTIAGAVGTRSDKLFLAGAKGFLSVDPALLKTKTMAPKVLLTELRVNNEVVGVGGEEGLLDVKLQLKKRLVLRSGQTNLTIGYTGLNYSYPGQNQYAYKLVGVDEQWNYVGNRREAFYSNLNPGTYQFCVTASNGAGVEGEDVCSMEIVILCPLWLRWWAWLFYVLVVCFVVYRVVLARHRKHELERSLKLKQLEQEKLEELAKERDRFFTHVTHEFRTPLTLIINPLEDLLQRYVHIVGVKDSLLLIRRNTHRLLSLVNSLMDIEKQHSGKATLDVVAFDFSCFMQEIVHSFASVALSRDICLEYFPGSDFLPVSYDRERLEQVLFNLLSNALKFTPSRGRVEVTFKVLSRAEALKFVRMESLDPVNESWLYIRVKDSGVGIDKEKISKIFEPFYHSDHDLHGQLSGSGIGLSLSKLIVEQHSGFLLATTVEPGTEMTVLLPLRLAEKEAVVNNCFLEEEPEVVSRRRPEVGDGLEQSFRTSYKLLFVEDNVEVLAYLEEQFGGEYTVLTAKNGREGLDIIEKELPDMVVSDVMMPVMDGLELCKRVKEDICLCHIPVILLTAKSMTMHIEEGFNVGADDYIAKPFNVSLLRTRIRNIFTSRVQMKEVFGKKISLGSLGIEVESLDQNFMERYVEIVKNNFKNPELDVDMICRELGMSRANFYKKLKAITDLSPAEMIRNIRLESAARLLKESKLTVSEVALQMGFSSNSYFGSCFKALYGMSPKEWKKES